MRRIKLSRRTHIPEPALKRFVKEAVKLNQALGDPHTAQEVAPTSKNIGRARPNPIVRRHSPLGALRACLS